MGYLRSLLEIARHPKKKKLSKDKKGKRVKPMTTGSRSRRRPRDR